MLSFHSMPPQRVTSFQGQLSSVTLQTTRVLSQKASTATMQFLPPLSPVSTLPFQNHLPRISLLSARAQSQKTSTVTRFSYHVIRKNHLPSKTLLVLESSVVGDLNSYHVVSLSPPPSNTNEWACNFKTIS